MYKPCHPPIAKKDLSLLKKNYPNLPENLKRTPNLCTKESESFDKMGNWIPKLSKTKERIREHILGKPKPILRTALCPKPLSSFRKESDDDWSDAVKSSSFVGTIKETVADASDQFYLNSYEETRKACDDLEKLLSEDLSQYSLPFENVSNNSTCSLFEELLPVQKNIPQSVVMAENNFDFSDVDFPSEIKIKSPTPTKAVLSSETSCSSKRKRSSKTSTAACDTAATEKRKNVSDEGSSKKRKTSGGIGKKVVNIDESTRLDKPSCDKSPSSATVPNGIHPFFVSNDFHSKILDAAIKIISNSQYSYNTIERLEDKLSESVKDFKEKHSTLESRLEKLSSLSSSSS